MLDEAAIKKEKINNQGAFKKVFSFIHKPEYIIKTWDDRTDILAKEEYETSIKYPNLFAKIPKINFNKRWMIQEKLDTNQIDKELNELINLLAIPYPNQVIKRLQSMMDDKDRVKNFLEFIENVSLIDVKKTQLLVLRWLKFLKEVDKIDTVDSKDINHGNMGYDKNGNLKLLDI